MQQFRDQSFVFGSLLPSADRGNVIFRLFNYLPGYEQHRTVQGNIKRKTGIVCTSVDEGQLNQINLYLNNNPYFPNAEWNGNLYSVRNSERIEYPQHGVPSMRMPQFVQRTSVIDYCKIIQSTLGQKKLIMSIY